MNTRLPPSRRARKPRRQQGSTFAELMLATLLVGTTVVASSSSLTESAKVYHYFADGPHEALMLAQEIHEAANQLPWEADPGSLPNFGEDVVTLWDLDDKVFSPPRSAGFEVVTSHVQWSQHVSVRTVDLENPTVVVDPDEFEGDTLTELTVTISQGNLEVDSVRWWMSEPAAD